MTALRDYARLEAEGLWRTSEGAQRRDVQVVLGETSLILIDPRSGQVLAHWSLPAVSRVNPGETPARFSPAEGSGEEVEVADTEMAAALTRVHSIIEARRPHPGRLRLALLGTALAAVVFFAFFWVPAGLISHAAGAAPEAARREIGNAVLADVFRVSGAACAAPEGLSALGALAARLFPEGGTEFVVVASGLDGARRLPGGYFLIGRALIEDHDGPEMLAAEVLDEDARAALHEPLHALLDWAGVGAAFRLLTTGTLPPERVGGYAETLMTDRPSDVTPEVLAERLAKAGVDAAPFAARLGSDGERRLVAASERLGVQVRPVLADGDWVALQGICGD
jgi:hypothetical protein